jgi:hypothetical protein
MHDFPDTALIRPARATLERLAPGAIVQHSTRAYLYAAAYGRKKNLEFDDEGLALAAIFHDLGLTPELCDPSKPFTFVSSRALRLYLEERNVDADRINLLCDAIEQHMQLFPRFSRGNEVGLLQVGAWMDVTGLRRWAIDSKPIKQAHPRQGFDLLFPATLLRSIGSFRACAGLLFPANVRA